MSAQPEQTVQKYFSGLAENTFQAHLGVVDPPLVDYVSDLLVRFVRSDIVHHYRGVTGRPLMTVTEMAAEAAHRIGGARRELHRHIGDFTLFWAGVYPEALRQHSLPVEQDQFHDYCAQGKRAYHLASQLDPVEPQQPESDLLERLSHCFELCCYGLREVRRQWEDRDDGMGNSGVILLG